MNSNIAILVKALSSGVFSIAIGAPLAFGQGMQTQVAQSGGVYEMPAGVHADDLAASDRAALAEISRPRIPIGDAELAAIKSGADTLRARGGPIYAPPETGVFAPGPLVNEQECITNTPTGSAPPDIHGAVSEKRLVVVTNVDVGIYKKSDCSQISFVSLKTFFNAWTIPSTQSLFDPKVIWDPRTKRFFLTAESRDSGNTDQYLYVAVSTSQNASAWRRYRWALSAGSSFFCKNAGSDFYDYPNTGVSKWKWFVTSNNFPSGGGSYGTIMSITKQSTVTGVGSVLAWCWTNLASNTAPPIIWDDNRKAAFASTGSGSGTSLTRYQLFTRPGANADTLTTRTSWNIPTWNAAPDCAQPNGQKLDSLDGRFQSASIQYGGVLYNAHTISNGSSPKPSKIRWYRLQLNAASTVLSTSNFLSFHSDGCVFNPSLATSDNSSAFITVSETSSTTNAAFWVWAGNRLNPGGFVTNVIQTSGTQFTTKNGTYACNDTTAPAPWNRPSCRWGDYSSAQVDPSYTGGGRMWGCNELTNGTQMFNWQTRCSQVRK